MEKPSRMGTSWLQMLVDVPCTMYCHVTRVAVVGQKMRMYLYWLMRHRGLRMMRHPCAQWERWSERDAERKTGEMFEVIVEHQASRKEQNMSIFIK